MPRTAPTPNRFAVAAAKANKAARKTADDFSAAVAETLDYCLAQPFTPTRSEPRDPHRVEIFIGVRLGKGAEAKALELGVDRRQFARTLSLANSDNVNEKPESQEARRMAAKYLLGMAFGIDPEKIDLANYGGNWSAFGDAPAGGSRSQVSTVPGTGEQADPTAP